jgi:hypothetical protein
MYRSVSGRLGSGYDAEASAALTALASSSLGCYPRAKRRLARALSSAIIGPRILEGWV